MILVSVGTLGVPVLAAPGSGRPQGHAPTERLRWSREAIIRLHLRLSASCFFFILLCVRRLQRLVHDRVIDRAEQLFQVFIQKGGLAQPF